jgi:hypothetical protein
VGKALRGGAALAAALLAGCARPAPGPPPAELLDPARLRRETLETLEALERGFYTHWGAVERTREFARLTPRHAPELRRVAEANVPASLMALRVLDRLAPAGESFGAEARAILYVSALERETNFARWGAPAPDGILPGIYGQELIALGGAAAPHLRRLLADRRRAPVRGAGSADRRNALRGDRVCDYAWLFLAAILGKPVVYEDDPDLRDARIRAFDLELDRAARGLRPAR